MNSEKLKEQRARGQEGRLVDSGKLKVESGKLNVYKSDKSDRSDKCISKSSQINILPKQHNVKDLSDLSDLSYLSNFKQKAAFTLSKVKSMFPLLGRGLGRGGNIKSFEQELSPSLKFVSSLVLDLLYAHRVRFRHFVPVSSICSLSGFRSLCSLHPYANPPFANKFFSLQRRDRKCAFTLAEVLVALGVIGVIASMTLPSVIQNYQKQRTVSQLKKAYTVMAQALKMSTIDNGDLDNWDVSNYPNSKDYVEKFFKPYLKTIKTCNTPSECGYKGPYANRDIWACYNSKGTVTCYSRWYPNGTTALVLPDGVHVIIQTIDDYGNAITTTSRTIFVDINGSKGPNAYGKDFFNFTINNKGLLPAGYNSSEQNLKSNCSKDGLKTLCTAKIVRDGWKIDKDYPW